MSIPSRHEYTYNIHAANVYLTKRQFQAQAGRNEDTIIKHGKNYDSE